MRRKDDTVELAIHPYLTQMLFELDDVYFENFGTLVITSGSEHDARHGWKSLHYAGCAVDIRTWEWEFDSQLVTDQLQYRWAMDVANAFCRRHPMLEPGDIDVVLESTHMHIELQPKRRA